jgi:hypothetical protein
MNGEKDRLEYHKSKSPAKRQKSTDGIPDAGPHGQTGDIFNNHLQNNRGYVLVPWIPRTLNSKPLARTERLETTVGLSGGATNTEGEKSFWLRTRRNYSNEISSPSCESNRYKHLNPSTVRVYTHRRATSEVSDHVAAISCKYTRYWSRLRKRFQPQVDSERFRLELLEYLKVLHNRETRTS